MTNVPTKTSPRPPERSLTALDYLNFTSGDVRDVFEPYLATFLTAERQFDPPQVGIVLAILAGKAADVWGRRPLLLMTFAATTLRAFLYGLTTNPWFVIFVQTLDGFASGILAVLLVIVVADLTQGTGRFNLAQGGIYTMIGIGAALGNLGIGFLAKTASFPVAFFTLSAVAALGTSWLYFAMPETK